MQVNSRHHKLFHSTRPFESGKCGKKKKNLQKFENLESEKGFLGEIKNMFHSFSMIIIL